MKLTLKFVLIGLLILSFSSCKQKETSLTNSKVKQYAKFISDMKSKGFMTGNILVYENGEVVFQSSDGLRSIDPIDSLTLNSQFRLASVSKQFTGVAIMKLKQSGNLDYDQKVNTILTDFPHDNITIKHLLHHTSGIADYIEIIKENFIPIIAPMGLDEKKQAYNINADTAAGALATSLKSRRLMLMTDVEGVYNKNKKLISEIKSTEAEKLIYDETISEGMIPKIRTCINAVNNGVRGVVVIDGRKPHSILFELFSDKGSGTLIRK